MRILLTGHTGYLGHHLVEALRAAGVPFATGGRRDADVALDLDDEQSLGDAVARARADVVLHAAAMSAMGACAADPEAAMRRNGEAVAALVRSGARVLFVSTDLVFDGGAAPYRSGDEPRPLAPYGRSKRRGEEHALAGGGVVARIPLLFGPSFDATRGATDMLRSARAEGRSLRLFTNELRTPMHVRDVATALVGLAVAGAPSGVLQIAGPERVSRFELAERFAAVHGVRERSWEPVECHDPARPRDVSMVSDLPTRALDRMLADA